MSEKLHTPSKPASAKTGVVTLGDLTEEQKQALFEQMNAQKKDEAAELINKRNELQLAVKEAQDGIKILTSRLREIQPPVNGLLVYQAIYAALKDVGEGGLTVDEVMDVKDVKVNSLSDVVLVEEQLTEKLQPRKDKKGNRLDPLFAYDERTNKYKLFKFLKP